MARNHHHHRRLNYIISLFVLLLQSFSDGTFAFTYHVLQPSSPKGIMILGSSSSSRSSQQQSNAAVKEDDDRISNEIIQLMSQFDPILLFASRLLPPQVAKDASALYAWCRRLDEITDDPTPDALTIHQKLLDWEDRFDALASGKPVDEMDAALTQCLQRNIDTLNEQPFRDMIAGMKSDAVEGIRTIDNMDQLEVYCYQVAGTVGCMLLPLLNADIEKATEPAIALGKSIQLINILRDAKPDAALGRIYLPQICYHVRMYQMRIY